MCISYRLLVCILQDFIRRVAITGIIPIQREVRTMTIDGIWKVEIHGPYNKEAFSTAFLKNGRYLGGSVSHYSIGRYKEDGGVFKAKIVITQYGTLRTMFGDKTKRVKVRMEGKVRKKGG